MTAQNEPTTTREHIIRVAVHLFAVKGYTQTGMEEIAKEVGITKPAVYYYFESKEKLLMAILDNIHDLQIRIMTGLIKKNLALPDLIEETIREVIRFLNERPDWFRLMFRLSAADVDLPRFVDLKKHHLEDHERFHALLEPALPGTRLRPGIDAHVLTDDFMNLIIGITTRWSCLDEIPDSEEAPRRLRDMFLYGVVDNSRDVL